ncbi:LemA protein [Anaerosphaera aminiphila DSM 21120]|uniref:LemA protein n=1 Tax=Anaerosphaera aminiphila DSM 21120 TaxID=1120995 RepID=A0A1M5P104_9FIRM|nr:LemA family protein [Anaerosphaera aminiphila]SHG95514.1 LemA protein [Anaerosphaera aminiphila DSM 21120]
MKKVIAVILAIVVVLGALIVPKYNKLVKLDNEVDASFAQVQVVVKRRADLIPNLVETVKGYATHEEETFQNITEARAGISSANNIDELSKANDELTSAISRLNFVVENYPELKANQNFLDLQAQLEGSENRISTERGRYNETVKEYNQAVRSFPMNMFAGIFGFDKKDYFEISEQDQEVPGVNF